MELPATTKEISVEWLNEVLHENGFLGNNNIASLKHKVIGVGEGYTGDIARIHLTYDNDSQQLPVLLVAKLPTSYESARSVGLRLGIYAREIQFYKEIAPSSPIRIPYCYFGDIDSANDKYVLLLEDCSKYSQPDIWHWMSIVDTKPVMMQAIPHSIYVRRLQEKGTRALPVSSAGCRRFQYTR
jgi:hypothetical protein